MNKEVIKAMNKKENTTINNLKKWWRNNSYKVYRVILFPLWIGVVVKNKIQIARNNKIVWNEEKATEILNYYVPRDSKWNEETHSFYFFDNGLGWNWKKNIKKNVKRKDRKFWKKYNWKIRTFLINDFELEGFKKITLNCTEGWTELEFVQN